MRVLFLTDDVNEEAIVSQALRLAGLSVSNAHTIDQVAAYWKNKSSDFIVVALRTSKIVDMVRTIRMVAIVPLVMVTDQITEDKYLEILEAGADLIFQRPFSPRMLMGHMQVLQRRVGLLPNAILPTMQDGKITLNPSNRTVELEGQSPHRLSQLEFRLLHTLMVSRGQVIPTETIVEHVWGYTGEGDRSLVRGLINRLRTKIEPNPNNPRYIHTIPSVGYMFGEEDKAVKVKPKKSSSLGTD